MMPAHHRELVLMVVETLYTTPTVVQVQQTVVVEAEPLTADKQVEQVTVQ
jgi:hypothetical protein